MLFLRWQAAVEKPGPDVAFDSCRADILEILLYLLHDELFHVLFDGQVRYVRTAFPSLFVRLSGGIGCRDLFGGVLGDRFGRKYVIWGSILGAAPFALVLPYVGLFWTITVAVIAGLVIASAFSAILVYATDLMPGKVGMISGVFFGFDVRVRRNRFGLFRLVGR